MKTFRFVIERENGTTYTQECKGANAYEAKRALKRLLGKGYIVCGEGWEVFN